MSQYNFNTTKLRRATKHSKKQRSVANPTRRIREYYSSPAQSSRVVRNEDMLEYMPRPPIDIVGLGIRDRQRAKRMYDKMKFQRRRDERSEKIARRQERLRAADDRETAWMRETETRRDARLDYQHERSDELKYQAGRDSAWDDMDKEDRGEYNEWWYRQFMPEVREKKHDYEPMEIDEIDNATHTFLEELDDDNDDGCGTWGESGDDDENGS